MFDRFAPNLIVLLATVTSLTAGEMFQLPTGNRAIFEPNGGEKFIAGTVGHEWQSGTFGCVRSDGHQMHEGLDIRAQHFDKRGEPTDAVMATADGTVVYINDKPSLSNYGNYVVIRHRIEGIDVFSNYAHLHNTAPGLRVGQTVKAGEVIATMGRTTNTRQGISKDRAHVHFEINLFVSDQFSAWYKKNFPNQRNDHGLWNGQNLVGLDPWVILMEQRRLGNGFSLLNFIRNQTELCRVQVRATRFSWLNRYPALVQRNPKAEKDGVAGYEIAFNFNGVPFQLIPRSRAEMNGTAKVTLLSVNAEEQKKNPCRKYVSQSRGRWELASHGLELVDMLTE